MERKIEYKQNKFVIYFNNFIFALHFKKQNSLFRDLKNKKDEKNISTFEKKT